MKVTMLSRHNKTQDKNILPIAAPILEGTDILPYTEYKSIRQNSTPHIRYQHAQAAWEKVVLPKPLWFVVSLKKTKNSYTVFCYGIITVDLLR